MRAKLRWHSGVSRRCVMISGVPKDVSGIIVVPGDVGSILSLKSATWPLILLRLIAPDDVWRGSKYGHLSCRDHAERLCFIGGHAKKMHRGDRVLLSGS
jgi:hypothetical protein